MELCRKQKATLVIAKLDRLARHVHFISGLMKSGVEFLADGMRPSTLSIKGMATITDEVIGLHDRIVGKLFNTAKPHCIPSFLCQRSGSPRRRCKDR